MACHGSTNRVLYYEQFPTSNQTDNRLYDVNILGIS